MTTGPRLMRLTGIPHPDINGGEPCQIFVDPQRIIMIERSTTHRVKEGSQEKHRQAMQSLFEEVERIVGEANEMRKTAIPDNEAEAQQTNKWLWAKETGHALSAAYQLVARAGSEPAYYPRIACTVISLACGTALEHGVMLARVFCMEEPAEIRAKLVGGNWE